MKYVYIGLGVLGVLLLGTYTYYLFTKSSGNSAMNVSPTVTPQPSLAISPLPTEEAQNSSTTGSNPEVERPDVIPNDWKSYVSLGQQYEFWYPPSATVSSRAENGEQIVTIERLGSTQKTGTEITDGYRLSMLLGTFREQTFEAFVKNRADTLSQSPTIRSIQGTDSYQTMYDVGRVIYVNGQPDRDYIYIPGPDNTYLLVVQIIEDPREQQFGVEASTIISTVRFR